MGYAKRTDSEHAAIVKALRQVGCKVSDTSRVGCGFPDLVVRTRAHPYDGRIPARVLLMEVKTARGRLTEDQQRFVADWPETVIVRSVSDALKAVGVACP